MSEALTKLFALVVDALTPRAIRVLLVATLVGLAYNAYLHELRLKAQEQALRDYQADYKVQLAGINAKLEAMLRSTDKGNGELEAIRLYLMGARPPR